MKDNPHNPDELQTVVAAISALGLQNASLSRSYFYAHLPLALIDSVFSIGVHYAQVKNVVSHFSNQLQWSIYRPLNSAHTPTTEQKSVREFLDAYRQVENPAAELFANHGYANPSSARPTRKADLVEQVATLLDRHGIQYFQDLQAYPRPEALDEELKLLPAMSSGIIVRYLRMLAGDDNQVKPDRWILRFFEQNLGRPELRVTLSEAVSIIQHAAKHFKDAGHDHVTARLIDHFIWSTQRACQGKTPTAKTPPVQTPVFCSSLPADSISIDLFWDACRQGGTTGNLEFGVTDDDDRLWIKSSKSTTHQSGEKCYKITRSTVRKYLPEADKKAFRANHGWFAKVFDEVVSRYPQP